MNAAPDPHSCYEPNGRLVFGGTRARHSVSPPAEGWIGLGGSRCRRRWRSNAHPSEVPRPRSRAAAPGGRPEFAVRPGRVTAAFIGGDRDVGGDDPGPWVEIRARQTGPLSVVWSLHRVYEIEPTLEMLGAAGIPAAIPGGFARSLLHFFGPISRSMCSCPRRSSPRRAFFSRQRQIAGRDARARHRHQWRPRRLSPRAAAKKRYADSSRRPFGQPARWSELHCGRQA